MSFYYTATCPKCGNLQVCEVNDWTVYILKCRYCGRATKAKKKKTYGLYIKVSGPYGSGKEAQQKCALQKKESR